ncbi:MAG: hypothetical protein Kow00104_02890 [Rhodothalassiaceae bacterium]
MSHPTDDKDIIGPLIEEIGRPGFDLALSDAGQFLCNATAALAFLHLPGRMLTLAASGPGERTETATMAAFRYSSRLWQSDPLLAADRADLEDGAESLRLIDRATLGNSPHGLRLLDYLGATHEMSLTRRIGRGYYILRFYGAHPCLPERIGTPMALMLSALIRHGELRKRSQPPTLRAHARALIENSLSREDYRLTPREIHVLEGILTGRTMEAIGLELGIAESSVRTYRKRAYRRLGICSQSQLFALCFNDLTAR